jgi:uncharacterized membrane-anchored protein YjiN (DUF445 family)
MKKSIKLPFTIQSGGNKKSYKLLSDNELNNKIKKTNIVNFVKKMIFTNSKNNNVNKVKYVKASNTKNYYNKINKK